MSVTMIRTICQVNIFVAIDYDAFVKSRKIPLSSFLRKPESIYIKWLQLVWTSVFTGVKTFYEFIKPFNREPLNCERILILAPLSSVPGISNPGWVFHFPWPPSDNSSRHLYIVL